jgi:formylglycine-generating enzyme required for sulfatase activity
MKLTDTTGILLALVLAGAPASASEPTLTLDLGDGVKLEMVLVKKGQFQQGSPPTEAGRGADDTAHPVTLTRDFYLGKYPVTRGQFERFVKETGYRTEAEKGPSGGYGFDGTKLVQRKEFTWRHPGFKQTDEHPVTLVTFGDAQAFVAWLAKKTGRPVVLPTEAQWEYACRAGSTTRFYNGNADADAKEIAWFKANAGDGTRPVGTKKPNRFGLYDMSGNVYQWCRDWYGPYPDKAVEDPEETRAHLLDEPRRVLRGGSWLKEAKHCRSAARNRNTPGSRNADNGFRVAVSIPPVGGKESSGSPAAPRSIRGLMGGVMAQMPSPSAGFFEIVVALFVCFGFFGIMVLILMIVLRRLSQTVAEDRRRQPPPRTTRPPSGRFQPRVVDDGFWVDDPLWTPGSTIHYHYWMHGTRRTGTHRIEPGSRSQFIYTGGTPSDIELINVVPPGQEPIESTGGSWEEPVQPPPASESAPAASSEPSSDFPSAY